MHPSIGKTEIDFLASYWAVSCESSDYRSWPSVVLSGRIIVGYGCWSIVRYPHPYLSCQGSSQILVFRFFLGRYLFSLIWGCSRVLKLCAEYVFYWQAESRWTLFYCKDEKSWTIFSSWLVLPFAVGACEASLWRRDWSLGQDVSYSFSLRLQL
mgnify:CR=1 FL=1